MNDFQLGKALNNFINYLCTFNMQDGTVIIVYINTSSCKYDYKSDSVITFEHDISYVSKRDTVKIFYGNMIIFIDYEPTTHDLLHLDTRFQYAEIRDNVYIARTDMLDNDENTMKVVAFQQSLNKQMVQYYDNLNVKFQEIANSYIGKPMEPGKAMFIHIYHPSFEHYVEFAEPDDKHPANYGYIILHCDEPYFIPDNPEPEE